MPTNQRLIKQGDYELYNDYLEKMLDTLEHQR